MRSNQTSAANSNNTTATTPDGSMTSNIDKLEVGLLQLKDNINDKATPNEVMMTAHLNIHPILMQIYGLTLEQEQAEEQHEAHGEDQ